jgi:hypothetical protein
MILAGALSCQKEKLEVEYNKQEAKISTYIESAMARNESYTTVNNGGSNRLTTVQGSGEALKADGNLTFYYAGYMFNGSVSPSGLFTILTSSFLGFCSPQPLHLRIGIFFCFIADASV